VAAIDLSTVTPGGVSVAARADYRGGIGRVAFVIVDLASDALAVVERKDVELPRLPQHVYERWAARATLDAGRTYRLFFHVYDRSGVNLVAYARRDITCGVASGTPFCRALGITHPIFSVGFGLGAGPELVAAVSRAGGCGVLGGSGVPVGELRRRIDRVRELTERPFGVNVILAAHDAPEATGHDRAAVREKIEAAVEARVALLILFWGDPAPFVAEAHRHGVAVVVQVGSVEEAAAAAAAGVDAVIAQGIEAGGHVRGTTSIWELLPEVVETLAPLPVLASGGIGDGAGLARALELGAQGVSLGTRFVASEEAEIHPVHKCRVVESSAADTVYTDLFDAWWPNAPHRVLRNRTFEEWEATGRPPAGARPGEQTSIGTRSWPTGEREDWPRYAVGLVPPQFEGDLERVPLLVGESCSAVDRIAPAAEIVAELVRDAAACAQGRNPMRAVDGPHDHRPTTEGATR
jgi:NAD(P)H-dependent flavin oxidoreductase YrpB (nitropropane dioxygenase family)